MLVKRKLTRTNVNFYMEDMGSFSWLMLRLVDRNVEPFSDHIELPS